MKKELVDMLGGMNNSLNQLLDAEELNQKLQKELKSELQKSNILENELKNVQDRLEEIKSELVSKNTDIEKAKVALDKEKEIKDSLSAQIADLKNRIENLEQESSNLKKTIESKEEAITGKENQLNEKEQQLNKFIDTSKKLEENLEKVAKLQEDIMKLQKENEELMLKEKDLQSKIDEANANYDKLKIKLRDSGDSVLGTTMELEKLKNEIEARDQEIQELKNQLGSLLTGKSGVLTSKDKLVELLKRKVAETHRSLRLCIPNIASLEELELLPILQNYPRTTVVNIAGDIKATDEHIILDLKNKGMLFTQYDQKDRWVLNRDGEDVIVALEKPGEEIVGFFSNETGIVSMFSSVIMDPWVKGIKI